MSAPVSHPLPSQLWKNHNLPCDLQTPPCRQVQRQDRISRLSHWETLSSRSGGREQRKLMLQVPSESSQL